MCFLSGAYGKLMAGKMVRSLQYEMTRVQSQLRRVTRQVGNMEKMFSAQERNMKMQMQAKMQASIFGVNGMGGVFQGLFGNGIDPSNPDSYQNMDSALMQKFSMYQQQQQYQYTMAQTQWQNTFEMMREAQLEPLKDLEDSLQTEKDNLESRLKIANQEYEAKKEEEKAGAKGLAPEYTGQ